MYSYVKRTTCDPQAPYKPGFYGTIEIPIQVGKKQRRMLAYVPRDVRESTAGILVLGENGKNADDLLKNSGWCEIADQEEQKEKLIVFFLEPEDQEWKINESYGISDGDVSYINAAALAAGEEYYFRVHESKIYLTGYREGGVMANMAALWNPAYFAGIVSVGGSAVLPEYIRAAGTDYCTELNGFTDLKHQKGIRKQDIPMPAWIIDDPMVETGTGNEILQYWKNACGTESNVRQINPDQLEFYRTKETLYPLNQDKNAYRVCFSTIPNASDEYGKRLNRRIWKDFLYRQRRWMSCPGGDLRVTQQPVNDIGMEYHYKTIDGWKREWYVYIPTAVKQRPETQVPLVFAMHGYTCSGEIYVGNSEWYKVAEKYGFIVVFPTALYGHVDMPQCGLIKEYAPLSAWNIFQENDRPDELHFFEQLLDHMIADYPVDENRIFATGHSWGSLMTQMLGLGMTERFAAIAPCSGVFFGGASKRMLCQPQLRSNNDIELPVWMFWGNQEEWLIPWRPKHDNETGLTVEMWLKKNHKSELIPKDWEICQYQKNGRFQDCFFEKEGTSPVRFTIVDYMPHATMPEMSFRIWEEFFSKFCREEDGSIFVNS